MTKFAYAKMGFALSDHICNYRFGITITYILNHFCTTVSEFVTLYKCVLRQSYVELNVSQSQCVLTSRTHQLVLCSLFICTCLILLRIYKIVFNVKTCYFPCILQTVYKKLVVHNFRLLYSRGIMNTISKCLPYKVSNNYLTLIIGLHVLGECFKFMVRL